MREIRYTALNDYCHCGAKMYRCIVQERVAQDDSGGEYFQTKVHDRCSGTELHIRQESTTIFAPLLQLGVAFNDWENHQLTRLDFDLLTLAILNRAGADWTKRVS